MSRTAQHHPLQQPSLDPAITSQLQPQQRNPKLNLMAEQPRQPVGAAERQPGSNGPQADHSLPHSLASSDGDDPLPTSVRGAPPELRRIIRKRQNSESAKRCRQRKKIENARTADEIMTQAAKLHRLEAMVGHLSRLLDETQGMLGTLAARAGHPVPPAPRRMCPHRHPQCGGAECAMCVRALHASSPLPPPPPPQHQVPPAPPIAYAAKVGASEDASWTHVSHAAAAMPGPQPQPPHSVAMPPVPVAQDIAAHTRQLQIVLGEPQPEDGNAVSAKVDEIESGAWQ